MSATLTWASSGLGAKTGTTNQTFLDDLDTLISSKSGDSTFFWEKAGKNSASTPRYLLLRRKDASAGRIAIIIWDSAPAANNAAILDTTPTSNAVQIAYFPAGTGTTLSNLTAASGTICGDDTGAVKCASASIVGTMYTTSFQHFYFDSYEAMVFCTQNPAGATTYAYGAGALLVDGADNAYDATFQTGGSQRWDNFSAASLAPFPYTTTSTPAGVSSSSGLVRTNYGSSNRLYFNAWIPSGTWCAIAQGPTDIMSDAANDDYWYIAPQLICPTVKGEGPVLKWRQIGFGPGTTSALKYYATTGPVVPARQATTMTTGSNTAPWMCNFKL